MIEATPKSNDKEENILFSPLKNEADKFFSLTNLRNDLFYSKDPRKVLEFYFSFRNVKSIIDWLENRPTGRTKIIEVEGDKDCIVIIPTANHKNDHSQRCKDKIFKGMHIIFVESGNYSDTYFSFSHSCNVGIKKALEYKPTFIVWSNDDMLKIDEPDRLRDELNGILNNRIKIVFARQRHQVSTPVRVVKFSLVGKFVLGFIRKTSLYYSIIEHLEDKFNFDHKNRFLDIFYEKILKLSLYCKFQTRFLLASTGGSPWSVLLKTVTEYINFDAFGIFRANCLNSEEETFDEKLMVQHSDQDISLRYALDNHSVSWIDYSIEGIGRATIKDTVDERLRNILADIYIDYKIRNNQYPDLMKIRNLRTFLRE